MINERSVLISLSDVNTMITAKEFAPIETLLLIRSLIDSLGSISKNTLRPEDLIGIKVLITFLGKNIGVYSDIYKNMAFWLYFSILRHSMLSMGEILDDDFRAVLVTIHKPTGFTKKVLSKKEISDEDIFC